MKDVMIDFETFGNGDNKVVCQLGAVYFDKKTGELGKELLINIDAASHIALGGVIDASTVYWWLGQSKEAQQSVIAEPRLDVKDAMQVTNDFLKGAARVWSHATFDFVTLMQTMKLCGIKPNVSYKSGMDLRTLVYLAGESVSQHKREGLHHNGLDDAKFQVKYAVAAMRALK